MDDYISRQAAIDECNKDGAYGYIDAYGLKQLPSADVQPVKPGHWYYDPNGMDWNLGAYRCSECGGKNSNIPGNAKDPYHWAGHRYCPNCGARMDYKHGEQKND